MIEYGVETPDNLMDLTEAQEQRGYQLRADFETIRMRLEESVSDHFSRVMTIVNKMRILGDRIEDVTVIEKILRSLTTKFNFVVWPSKNPKILMISHLMSCKEPKLIDGA